MAELVDRPGEALGDLPVLGNLKLAPAGLDLAVGEERR
jgi:hypothetical protein